MKYINHKLRATTASQGSIQCDKMYGIGSEGELSRADTESFDKSAPGCLNVIKSESGGITKRFGYYVHKEGAVDSVHIYRGFEEDVFFYLYKNTVRWQKNSVTHEIDATTDVGFCRSMQWGDYMIFYSSKVYIVIDMRLGRWTLWTGTSVLGHMDSVYLPTIYIGCTPDGAGQPYEAVNILSPKVAEQFAGDGTTVDFNVHLEAQSFEAFIKQADGSWKKTAVDNYSHTSVRLKTAPPEPSVTGEDNVRIEYVRSQYNVEFLHVTGCRCAATFGVNGLRDRIFMSGNTTYAGRVIYSHMDNPYYFSDVDYIEVGDSETDVSSLIRQGDSLGVVTEDSIYSVKGKTEGVNDTLHDALFVIDDIYATPEPVTVAPPCYFMDEPVYITSQGVCAIAPSGVLDERCANLRSERINSFLLAEDSSSLDMIVYQSFLIISNRKNRLYLLDGRHYVSDIKSKRYEGYIWEGIKALSMWVYDGRLFFSDGKRINVFHNKPSENAYCDEHPDGLYPIKCHWETPMLYPSDFKDIKFFKRVGVSFDPLSRALCDSVRITAIADGGKSKVLYDNGTERSVFCYGDICYGAFTYRECIKSYAVSRPILQKRCRGIKLRFENDRLRHPMAIKSFGADYIKM